MTDPAQVTEPVTWWQALMHGLLGISGLGIALAAFARAFGIRSSASARVQVAQVQAQASREADATGRQRLEAQLEAKADAAEHSLAVAVADRERAERIEAQGDHHDCMEELYEVRLKLAVCETDHKNAAAKAAWFEKRLDLLDGGKRNPEVPAAPEPTLPPPPPPRVRPPTPANGTDIVRPVARKDPRRDP